jgi:signal transduction histidine kinase
LVNRIAEERRRLAQELTYRDIANAIFHEDGHFSQDLMQFLHDVGKTGILRTDKELLSVADRLSFYADDKLGLYQEFRSTPNPIRDVPPEILYPSLREDPPRNKDISVKEIQTVFEIIKDVYCGDSNINVNLAFGKFLKKRKNIPNFDSTIMARILSNLVRNSTDAANEAKTKPHLDIVLELMQKKDEHEYLQIIAEDNCGGFKEEDQMPSKVTVLSWSEYRSDKEKAGGMGFLMLARYADVTDGSFYRKTIKRGFTKGARVELKLGLCSRRKRKR